MQQLNLNTLIQVAGGYSLIINFTDNNQNTIRSATISHNGSINDFAHCIAAARILPENQDNNFSAVHKSGCSIQTIIHNTTEAEIFQSSLVVNVLLSSIFKDNTCNADWIVN